MRETCMGEVRSRSVAQNREYYRTCFSSDFTYVQCADFDVGGALVTTGQGAEDQALQVRVHGGALSSYCELLDLFQKLQPSDRL